MSNQANRREALKMLGFTFLGAAIGGGTTYADIKTESGYIANAMTNGLTMMGELTEYPPQQVHAVAKEVLKENIRGATGLSAMVGAFVTNLSYHWVFPRQPGPGPR